MNDNRDELGWLIESNAMTSDGPQYYGMTDDGTLNWTNDSLKAVRFARKVDAEMMIGLVAGHDTAFASEHMWCGEEKFINRYARCCECNHLWIATAPVEADPRRLECPKCGAMNSDTIEAE